jgi:hypothetical protein
MAQGTSRSAARKPSSATKRNSSSNGASAKPRSRTASSSKRTQSSRASSGARRSTAGGRTSSAKRSTSSRTTGGAKNPVETVRDTVSSGARSAGQAAGTAASKAKGPALAGGAALAGMVGGMTLASRGGRRRVLGVPVPGTRRPLISVKRPARAKTSRDLVKAAGHVGNAGLQMAELAAEMRLAREQMGDGRRRSPVEVVLDGLTARRPRR